VILSVILIGGTKKCRQKFQSPDPDVLQYCDLQFPSVPYGTGGAEEAAEFLSSCREGALLFRSAVQNYADFFEGDQAAFDHFVELRQDLVDALLRFDDFENHGQILRQA
jgi:hypothetical protein